MSIKSRGYIVFIGIKTYNILILVDRDFLNKDVKETTWHLNAIDRQEKTNARGESTYHKENWHQMERTELSKHE